MLGSWNKIFFFPDNTREFQISYVIANPTQASLPKPNNEKNFGQIRYRIQVELPWLSFGQIFWRINHTTTNKLSRSRPNATCLFYHYNVPVQCSWYSDSLRTGRRWGRGFPHPSRPALGPPSLPYIGNRVSFAVVKWLWRGVDHGFGGLVVSMLASGSRVRGFKPGRFFWCKNPQHAFLRRGS
jgi:hypothetical protein